MSSWCVLDQKWAILGNSFQGNNSWFYQNEEKVCSSLVEGVSYLHTLVCPAGIFDLKPQKSHSHLPNTVFVHVSGLTFPKRSSSRNPVKANLFSSLITWASLKTPISTEFKNSLLATMLSHSRKEPLKCLLWQFCRLKKVCSLCEFAVGPETKSSQKCGFQYAAVN